MAAEKRAAFRDWEYWGRPIPGFGDPDARVVLLGLAPAAHGANRTGRVFTGDRSGDFLFAALHATGYANQPTSVHRDDGLRCTDCFITAAVRCAPPANKPLPSERETCADWLERELALLEHARVIVCLGQFAWNVAAPRPRPPFGHGAETRNGRYARARLLPPEPAEHVHGQADGADDRGRAAPGARAGLMRAYAAVLRVPHVAALIATTLLARFPIGINALAIILYLREERGSFAVAGVVAGALAAGSGIGAPVQGRLVDAFGQRRVLVPLGFVHAAALGAIVAGTEAGAPVAVLVACGFVAGFAIPPTSSVLRSMWPTLLRERPELMQAAYALDSVLIELIFVLGPLVTALIATTLAPPAALIVSAASVVLGTVGFTALPPSRAMKPAPRGERAGALGALASPGVRTLVLTSLPMGVGIGICEVTLPAFSDASGAAATAGLLLAVWSLGSAAGGLFYGAWPNRPPLQTVHLAVTALLPLSLLPLAAAPSVPVMALLVIPAGMFIAPLLATRNEMVGWVAPEGARTEAYTWPVTAFVGGIAIGAALAGAIVESASWQTAFLIAGAVGSIGTVIAVARRRTVLPPVGAT